MRYFVWALVFAVSACGSDESQSDADLELGFPDGQPDTEMASSAVGLVELCDRYARASCTLQVCFNPNQSALEEGCVEAVRERCEDGVFGPVSTHVQPGTMGYSPDAAGTCLAPYLSATCEGLSGVTGSPPPECDEVFVGTLRAGAPCEFDQMCEGDLFCKPGVDGTCPGTCAARASLGAACNGLRQLCEKNLLCTGFGDRDGTCVVTQVARDGECATGSQCPSGQLCDAGRCRNFSALGEACPGFGCQQGLLCTGEPGTCQPVPSLGEPCRFTCTAGTECSLDEAVCVVAPTKAGDACIPSVYPCGRTTGLQCRSSDNVCVGPLALGAACGGDTGTSRCDFGWCDGDFMTAGQCQPWKALGEACEPFDGSCGPFECFQGKCSLPGGPCRGPRLGQW